MDYVKRTGNIMESGFIHFMLVLLLICGPFATGGAQDLTGEDLRSLDGQVQEIKSDVLSIASELNNLEERLLYNCRTRIRGFCLTI